MTGVIAGAVTIGYKSTIEDNCEELACNREGLGTPNASSTSGTVADVGLTVGVLASGAAIALWLLAPEGSATKATPDSASADKQAQRQLPLRLAPVLDASLAHDTAGTLMPQGWLGARGQW